MKMMSEKLKGTKAHQRYRTKNDEIVPGVTTITGLLNKPALVPWANRLGLQGIDSSKYRDKAADIGTLAHELVEQDLGGPKVDYSIYSGDTIDKAQNAVQSFYKWQEGVTLGTVHMIEAQLVSEEHRYGGTIDVYADIDGKSWLIDLKTGKALYWESAIQVAAYRHLLLEHGYQVDGVRILRVGRDETEGFEDRVLGNQLLDDCFAAFIHLKGVYDLQKKIKKACG